MTKFYDSLAFIRIYCRVWFIQMKQWYQTILPELNLYEFGKGKRRKWVFYKSVIWTGMNELTCSSFIWTGEILFQMKNKDFKEKVLFWICSVTKPCNVILTPWSFNSHYALSRRHSHTFAWRMRLNTTSSWRHCTRGHLEAYTEKMALGITIFPTPPELLFCWL